MKQSFENFWMKIRIAFCAVIVFLTCGNLPVLAQTVSNQTDLGNNLLQNATNGFKHIVADVVVFLQVTIGIAGLVTIIMAVVNLLKDERDAAAKIGKWILGLVLGFALVTALGSIISGIQAAS